MASFAQKVGTGRAGGGAPHRRLSIAFFASAVALASGWGAARYRGLGSDPAHAAQAVESNELSTHRAKSAAFADEDTSRWQVGTEVTFELDYASWMDQSDDGSRLFSTTAGGTLLLTVVESSRERRLLAGSASGLATSFEGGDLEADTVRRVNQDLQHPFFIELASNGAVTGVWLRVGQHYRTGQLVRSLSAALQFVASDDPRASRWSTRETDTNGPFLAHYARTGELVEKRKDLEQLPAALDGVQHSLAKYTLDRHGFVERVDLQETAGIPVGPASFEMRHEVHLRMLSARRTRAFAPNLDGYVRSPLTGIDTGVSGDDAQRLEDEELARGQTFRGLTTRLGELRPGGYTPEYDEARSRLVALLRIDDRAVEECLEKLKGDLSPGERASLLGALSNAGTPSAQGALMVLAKDRTLPADTRQEALVNASMTGAPSATTLRDISALAEDDDRAIRSQAALALGAAARSAAGSEDRHTSDAAGVAASELVASFERAQSPEEQMLYASAVGNAGGPEALEISKQILDANDPELRARGVNALRFVEGPEADRLLAEAVGDASPEVRTSALSAAQYRSYNEALHTAIDGLARTDGDVSVRNAALNVLSKHAHSSLGARRTLKWMSQHDPDPELRAAAGQALAGGS
jgi:HEAT repeat protein